MLKWNSSFKIPSTKTFIYLKTKDLAGCNRVSSITTGDLCNKYWQHSLYSLNAHLDACKTLTLNIIILHTLPDSDIKHLFVSKELIL